MLVVRDIKIEHNILPWKHAACFSPQWDCHLPAVLWAYRNSSHESTKEKPSFLLFGVDLRSCTDAAFLPPQPASVSTTLEDYREELVTSLSSARELAAKNIVPLKRKQRSGMTGTKSTLEIVSNPVYCCINSVFRELRHNSAMNIILRPSLSS